MMVVMKMVAMTDRMMAVMKVYITRAAMKDMMKDTMMAVCIYATFDLYIGGVQ